MSKIRLEFFATPDEQRRWIERLLTHENVWCLADYPPPNRGIEVITDSCFFTDATFRMPDAKAGIKLYFGLSDLVPSPIWRTTSAGFRELDFIPSQAIQYDPSMVVGDNILLEGQMAIVRPIQYEEVGIDPKPIMTWFRQVAKSFLKLTLPGGVVLRDPATGDTHDYPEIRATPGATEWWRSGHLLKQFAKGAYEFDIRTSEGTVAPRD